MLSKLITANEKAKTIFYAKDRFMDSILEYFENFGMKSIEYSKYRAYIH